MNAPRPSRRVASAALLLAAALGLARQEGAADPPAADAEVSRARDALVRFARDPLGQQTREAALRTLGGLGGRDAAQVVATVMDDPFVHLRDRAVSAWIEMARGPRAEETIAWLAEVALHDRRSMSARRGAAIALGVAGGAAGAKALVAAARTETAPPVLVAIAEAVERLGEPAAEALGPLLASTDGSVVGAAARALGRIRRPGDAGVALLLPPILAHRHPLARAGAIDGLAAAAPLLLVYHAMSPLRADPRVEPRIALADALPALARAGLEANALEALRTLLADPSWRVRAAACEAATGVWSRAAIPLLLERLRRESGRLRGDVRRALCTLGGEDLGPDADLWAAWWTTRGGGIDLGPRPVPDAFGRVRRPDPAAPPPGGEARTASFFRVPVVSEALAFLFDLSGSMQEPVEGAGSKAALARAEFSETAAGLSKRQAFDVFVYRYPSEYPPAPLLTRALGRLTPGGEGAAKRATDWLEKEEPRGWGAFYDALVEVADEDVDTIVLLSDGIPSRGTYDRDYRLIAEFVRANRFRRVAVDTVLVGRDGADRTFMRDLADATGGRFEEAVAGGGAPVRGR